MSIARSTPSVRTDRPGYTWACGSGGAGTEAWRPSMGYLARMLSKYWAIDTITMLDGGGVVVSCRPDRDNRPGMYRWWMIGDNGGEIHMREINNDDLPPRDVPYDGMYGLVPIGRVAWMIAMTLLGQPIPIENYIKADAVDDLTLMPEETRGTR